MEYFGKKIDKLVARIMTESSEDLATLFPTVEQYLDYKDGITVLIKESIMRGMMLVNNEPIKAVPDVLEAIEDWKRERGL